MKPYLLVTGHWSLVTVSKVQQLPSSDSYIQPITETIGGGRIVIHRVNFHLDPSLVGKITQQRHHQQPLTLPPPLRNTLRQYSLNEGQGSLPTGLTFYTYLHQQPLIKSYIASDGDIIHQIHQHSLHTPESALALFQAHQWLIEQILTQMSWRRTHILQYLSWLMAGLLIVVSLFFLPPLVWLFTLPFWWLLQRGMQALIKVTLRHWLWRQLLRGKASRQNLAWRLLKL